MKNIYLEKAEIPWLKTLPKRPVIKHHAYGMTLRLW